ncbi:MAG: site-specific integrase [Fuerstiella sp.]
MVHVKLIKRPGRPYFEAEYIHPLTGKRKRQSLKTKIKREAERLAGKLQRDLEDGRHIATRKTKWAKFRKQYLAEGTAGLAVASVDDIRFTLDKIEAHLNPYTLQEIDALAVSRFRTAISKERGNTDSSGKRGKQAKRTTAKNLRNLKRMLRWAHRHKLIVEVPAIDMPKGISKGKPKGRRITTEELERILNAVAKVIDEYDVDPFKRLILGLWLSGLRIGEALNLQWDDSESAISVDLSGKHPMFRIPDDADKSKKASLLPIVPEFHEWLMSVGDEDRHGKVFPLTEEISLQRVSKKITAIGRKANVFVTKVKPASAHDFRRSFGFRWADKVKPHILQRLMRHDSIQTTMEYYVVADADDVAEAVWKTVAEGQDCTSSVPLPSVEEE